MDAAPDLDDDLDDLTICRTCGGSGRVRDGGYCRCTRGRRLLLTEIEGRGQAPATV